MRPVLLARFPDSNWQFCIVRCYIFEYASFSIIEHYEGSGNQSKGQKASVGFNGYYPFFQEKPPTLPATERTEQSVGVATLQEPNVQVTGPTFHYGWGMRAATGMAPPRAVPRGLALACSRFHQSTAPSNEPDLRSNCPEKRPRWGVRSCWALAHAECHRLSETYRSRITKG